LLECVLCKICESVIYLWAWPGLAWQYLTKNYFNVFLNKHCLYKPILLFFALDINNALEHCLYLLRWFYHTF
jgi:hypothetical protein